jgi:hypothetical protein
MNKTVVILITVLVAAVFAGLLTYSMISARKIRVEVCVTVGGHMNCRIASGATEQEAIRTATDAACATLADGFTCSKVLPTSVKRID